MAAGVGLPASAVDEKMVSAAGLEPVWRDFVSRLPATSLIFQ
jgi:hypothetical protein